MKKNKHKLESIAATYYEKQLIKAAIKEKKLQFITIK
tara:strand:- start:24 stop:134 length:111 start_codon:yes stop_codon:yes gene_type:complete